MVAAGLTTGAVYLVGYGVECLLKALVLASVPVAKQAAVLATFRGNRAHDFEWLRNLYRENGGAALPRAINTQFTLVNDWSTALRYEPATYRSDEAEKFLVAAAAIIRWADGRL